MMRRTSVPIYCSSTLKEQGSFLAPPSQSNLIPSSRACGPFRGDHTVLSQGVPSPNTSLLSEVATEAHERPSNKSFDHNDILPGNFKKPQTSLKTTSKEFVPKHRKNRSLGSATSLNNSLLAPRECHSQTNISFEMGQLNNSFQAPEMPP